jgi:para-nitrobenzyl esterase
MEFIRGLSLRQHITNKGKIEGNQRSGGGAEFLGIPYAKPPVGNLRWREPVPMEPWLDVRKTTKFGSPCSQPVLGDWNRRDAETSNEDCLFLNVITPTWPIRERLPVMFWIHGGANTGGTASSTLYKDGTLVNHGVILVTINYRLSIFGFLSHPELTRESSSHSSGNYALMDLISGLRWVRDNIAQFGGDPNNVTVFGQSAGGQNTSLLMTSSLAKGLFHRAIVQSGSGINPPCNPLIESERSGQKVVASLNVPAGEGVIKYLRGVSSEELLKTVSNLNPTQPLLLAPNVDGHVIMKCPDRVFSELQQFAIPMLIGTTAREFGFSAPASDLRKFIENVTGSLGRRALELYGLAGEGQGATDSLYGSAGDQWFADLLFRCPVTTQAMWHSSLNKSTYEYELTRAIPGQESQGAVHSTDLPYVFGYFPKTGNISGTFSETDFRLADLVEKYWTNFAKTGNPNSSSVPNWPEFGTSQSYLRFNQTGEVTIMSALRKPQCDLLREVYRQRLK